MKPKKNRWYLRALALMLVSGMTMVTFSAAAEAGSKDDPLVTMSYLNETYLPKILAAVQGKISGSGASGEAGAFVVVDLKKGQTVTLALGGEVMLRAGSAVCAAGSAPGLIDETSGGSIDNGGALVKNHLYMSTLEGRGVKAGSEGVKVLVRGSYTAA